ncbi:hypothetical protein A2U01_0100587, partial [Trifolium medium]|nr:hypothetical protein [Trifolium medium]
MLQAAECSDDEGVANVHVGPGDHAGDLETRADTSGSVAPVPP